MRTASRRARRLGGLLLLAATLWWAFMRRRANAVRWVEPPATRSTRGAPAGVPAEPGGLPDDVLATDAGLTELPEPAAEGLVDTVDETRVAELLAESSDADLVVVDEASYEHAIADAAPEPPAEAEAEAEVVATGPDVAEPSEGTSEPAVGTAAPSAAAAEEEPTERELAAPGVDEPTVSIRPEADEEAGRGIPMPTFSEAPTMEIPAVSDDLRAVRGIGPSMERKLHGLGIVSYRQLALLDGAELEQVRAELTDFRNRIEREDWAGQARALHREKYGRDPA